MTGTGERLGINCDA